MARTIHYDKNKDRCFELARLTANKLIENPFLIDEGRKYLERHVKTDPSQRPYYGLWLRMLELRSEEIAARLLADGPEGALLRDTKPVFCVPTAAERREAFARSRRTRS